MQAPDGESEGRRWPLGEIRPASPAVVKVVERLLFVAHRERVRGIHIEPDADGEGAHVRFRGGGKCRWVLALPPEGAHKVIRRLMVMADLDPSRRGLPQEGVLRLDILDQAWDLTVTTLPTIRGEAMVLTVREGTDRA